jgi:hypothetical protein
MSTLTEIESAIQHLDKEALGQLSQWFEHYLAERQLSGKELSALADRLTRTTDPAEAALVRETIHRGFYGGKPNA